VKNYHTGVTEGGSVVGGNIIANNGKPLKPKKSGSGGETSLLCNNIGKADGPLGSGKGPNKSKPGLSNQKSSIRKPKNKPAPKGQMKGVAKSGYSDYKFKKPNLKY